MAKKKKEQQRFFGQMPIPNSRKRYRTVKSTWEGLNRRLTTDSGGLSDMAGMSTKEYPHLVPSKVLKEHKKIKWPPYISEEENYREALGIFGFDDFLVVIYKSSDKIMLDYIDGDGNIYSGVIKQDVDDDSRQRCVVQFNVLDDILDPVGSGVTKKLIILPDKKTIDFKINEESLNEDDELVIADLVVNTITFENTDDELSDPEYLKTIEKANRQHIYQNKETGICYEWYRDTEADIAQWQVCEVPLFPDLDFATVSHGRLFGVGRGRIYASGFNDYSNWTFDTADEYNDSNAWCSSAQANTKDDGDFTGITSYQGHVLALTKDVAYEIYNTKNPFRVLDIYGDGTIDNRTIQEVGGILFFVSKGSVHAYNTSSLKDISYDLGIDVFMEEDERDDVIVSGTDGRNYYLWISRWDNMERIDRETIYVYDTFCGQWSVLVDNSQDGIKAHPVGIATNKNGVFFLRSVYDEDAIEHGSLLTLGDVTKSDTWYFETDLMTNKEYDIKHLKKVQLRTYIDDGAKYTIKAILSDGTMQKVFDSENRSGDIVARFVLRKTAAYGIKLRFEGCGYVRFHNLELIYEDGGEINVTT